VGLRLIFVIVTRAVSLLGLSRREWWWKDAEMRLAAMRLIVTPGTILRWRRGIVRRRWGRLSRRGRSGRPATHRKLRSAVLRLSRENESWGYRRIHGELAGLGIAVAPSTIWQILRTAGINQAPRRDGPGWAEFLQSQAQEILAPTCSAARRSVSLPSSSTAPAASGSWELPSIRPGRG
jgi:hypothetical protein